MAIYKACWNGINFFALSKYSGRVKMIALERTKLSRLQLIERLTYLVDTQIGATMTAEFETQLEERQ